ncbi:[ribosomal protein S5]-alanine N-acetyltransferase [Janthinobacterium sp. CG_23.3]|uniref:GNAT family N-acetyltransferase n=1 Tax=Janthinobacterium sp. CG_23.3 TaxID=3349634 RepID=UPI0038D4DBCA
MSGVLLSSSRIAFRPLTLADVSQEYVDWLCDPEVSRFLEARHVRSTLAGCREYVAAANANDKQFLMGMFDLATSKHIGNIKIGLIDYQYMSGDLSLFIGDKTFWRRGYAGEAIQRITGWGFEQLKLEKIGAGCYENNTASLRAFLKSGYAIEGFFRKQVRYEGRRIGVIRVGITAHDVE